MVEGSEMDISNLKFLLLCFQLMSGLKINFDKSDVMVMGYSPEECLSIANRLNCLWAPFPRPTWERPLAILGSPLRTCSRGLQMSGRLTIWYFCLLLSPAQ